MIKVVTVEEQFSLDKSVEPFSGLDCTKEKLTGLNWDSPGLGVLGPGVLRLLLLLLDELVVGLVELFVDLALQLLQLLVDGPLGVGVVALNFEVCYSRR